MKSDSTRKLNGVDQRVENATHVPECHLSELRFRLSSVQLLIFGSS
jgi:hypothetical protein